MGALLTFSGDIGDTTYTDSFELWINEIAFMMSPHCILILQVLTNHIRPLLNIRRYIANIGRSPSVGGQITTTIPGALGTLSDPTTQSFSLGLGESTIITRHLTATGVGNHTITFARDYDGFPSTPYSTGIVTRYLNVTAGIPLPCLGGGLSSSQ